MKKIFTLLVMFSAILGLNAQSFFSEDFEAGNQLTMDAEWYQGPAAGWASQYFDPGANTTNFIGINDDALGDAAPPIPGSRASFGPIDLSMATNPILSFDAFFVNGDFGGDETFKVYFSYEGTNYFELLDVAASAWETQAVRLDLFSGGDIWLAFEYNDGGVWNYGACVDNISVEDYTIQNDVRMVSGTSSCGAAAVGTEVFFSGQIQSMGLTNLNSFDINWTDGVNSGTETIEGIDVVFRDFYNFDLNSSVILSEVGTNNMTFTLSNPNGMEDEVADNNEASIELTGVPTMDRQAIVVEEATGTWCTWCPRGAVWLDRMASCFGESFVGVAVHNQDPMVLAEYDSGLTSTVGFQGFPSVLTDRTTLMDPSEIEAPTIAKVTTSPDAIIGIAADWDDATRTLNVTGYADMNIPTTTGFRWVGVLTEDGVTGTDSGYDQINAYSGGGNGPMGGYEFLPNPVPAAQMVYDHVGRALLAGYAGMADPGLENLEVGGQAFFDFNSYVVPAEYNVENMHIIVMLIAPNGQIINASTTGLVEATVTGIESAEFDHDLARVYPNPANDLTNIRLDLAQPSDVTLTVFNTMGQTMVRKDYGSLSGDMILPFNTTELNAGNYFLHITVDDKLITKTLQVVK